MDLPINTGFGRGRRGMAEMNDHLDFPSFPNSSMSGFGMGSMSQRMDQRMKEMEQQMSAMRSDFFKRSTGMNMGMPGFGSSFGPPAQFGLTGQAAPLGIGSGDEHLVDDNGTKKFKLEYSIGNFDPEEISVKTEGHTLRVHALRDKNDGGHREHKEFKRDCTIPANVDPEAITSHLTPEGVLVLEAPVVLAAIEDKRKAAIEDRRSSSSPSTVLASSAANDDDHVALRTDSPSQTALATATAKPKFGRQNSAVIEEADGGRKIKLEFNLEGFNPEDLSLKVTPENTLKIEAIHEEAKGGSTSKKEFRREIGLPESADASNMKSVMNAEGILTVDIPVPTPAYNALPAIPNQFEATMPTPPALSQAAVAMDAAAIANLPAQFQTTVNTEAVTVDKENGVQRVKFNVQNFQPEEIDLKVVDNILRVHAVHKSTADGSNVHREYSRQFTLPEGIDLEAMKSTLSEEGILEVEVPLAPEKPKQRKIQIKML